MADDLSIESAEVHAQRPALEINPPNHEAVS
jgi:hypothetical protein